MMFVGDSLNRGQYVSMVCLLHRLIPEDQKSMETFGSLTVFTAKEYNATIEFYWAPFLLESNSDDAVIHRVSERIVRRGSINKHGKNWKGVDIIVFNTYLWWMTGLDIKILETHVWFVLPDEFKSVSLLNQYMELLSPCEKENVLTMRGDQLQKRALLARALFRVFDPAERQPNQIWFKKKIDNQLKKWNELFFMHFINVVNVVILRNLQRQTRKNENISLLGATISKSIIVTVPVASVLQEAIVAFWDQINNHVVDPRSFKFRKNVHGKPEIMMPQVALDASIKVSAAPGIRKVMDSEGGICESFGKRLLCCTFQDFHNSREGCNQFWVVESSDHPESLTNNWQFGLFELASSHYASICMEKDKTSDVAMRVPLRLTVRKTIPFVEDICISGTDAVVPIAGLIKQV
ncbi:hypothetical protein OIU77_017653 [Salix suchowensis]|uniref:Trichome birefringence-like C-terminal domain-containing protein n=1 Tax=Salix suchowensis TaxID=1278906 RepID=A0ABQ8ZQ32_9ROSI|nr:hypothetical protein OIU77_017653 [Salix suchowensis]